LEDSQVLLFLLLVRAACRRRQVWSIGGIILTGENQNTWSKTCPSATLSTTNVRWMSPGIKPGP